MHVWNSANAWEEMSNGLRLLRGFQMRSSEDLFIFSSPEDRKPVNMPLPVQVEIDNWFEAQFGIRFRQRSIFATGSLKVARAYARDTGEVRMLHPVNDFCFCWSPKCEDLYAAYENSHSSESIPMLLDRLEFRSDNLHSALLSNNEIMLVCSCVQAQILVLDKI